jgi:hypothetical protein
MASTGKLCSAFCLLHIGLLIGLLLDPEDGGDTFMFLGNAS